MSETFDASFDDRLVAPEIQQLHRRGRVEIRRRLGPGNHYRLDRFTHFGDDGELLADRLVGFNLQARSSLDLARDYWPDGRPRRKHSTRLGPNFEVVSLQRQAPGGRLEFAGRVSLNRRTGWVEIASAAYDGQANLLAGQSWSANLKLESPQQLQTRRPDGWFWPAEAVDPANQIAGWPAQPPGLLDGQLTSRTIIAERPEARIDLADGGLATLFGFEAKLPPGRQQAGYAIHNRDGFWASELVTYLDADIYSSRQSAREFWGHGLLRREVWLQLAARDETTRFRLLRPNGQPELEVVFEFDRINGGQQTTAEVYDDSGRRLADQSRRQLVKLTPAAG